MTFRAVNPSTGERIADYPLAPEAEVETALARAERAFGSWSRLSVSERGAPLRRLAALLRERAGRYAERMALEMGKPLPQGRGEAEKCAFACEHYAKEGARALADIPEPEFPQRAMVVHRPLGAVLAIMPWNFPFWQVLRFFAPTALAGNVVILKHAENVPGCAEEIAALVADAGFPPGVFQNLRVPVERIAGLIARPEVRAVTITGSTRAGRAVAAAAGGALKPAVLELGGSDPYVVLADADLDLAARTCVTSRLINGGQSCIAAKRFIVVEPVREAFTERVVAEMGARRCGDPIAEPDAGLGPMAREDLRDALHEQVRRSVAAGARLLLGGEVPRRKGWFYPPTVIDQVPESAPVFREETFGPVATIIAARDEAHAIALANGTTFGLGAAVFTKDVARGERIARESLEAGCCFVNDFVRSDPRLPFGGVRDSGFGRELGEWGVRSFVNVKTVVVGS